MPQSRPHLGIALAALAAVAGCAAIAGIDGFDVERPGPSDAGPTPDTTLVDAQPDAASDLDAGCPLAVPPERPDASGPEAPARSFVFALNFATFDTIGDASVPPGYDLDRKCTCAAPDSCVRPAGRESACDGPGGRDIGANAVFAVALKQIGAGAGDITNGRTNLLLAIDDVDSLVDDPQVSVGAVVSDGTPIVDGNYTMPRFDGNDVWTLDRGSATPGPKADSGFYTKFDRYTDKAYISGGVLVASIPLVSIREGNLNLGSADPNFVVPLDIEEALVTARFAVRDAGPAELLDGVIAGRVNVESFLTSLAVVPDSTDGGHLCGESTFYPSFRAVVCNGADIAKSALDDGKALPCSAMAVGVGFTALKARAGKVLDSDPIVNPSYPCGLKWRAACDAGP